MKTIVILELAMSNDNLLDVMRGMKIKRENGIKSIVALIHGFNSERREVWEIPEVRAFCRRLVSIGFISYLDMFPELNGEKIECLTALEIYLNAEGRFGKNTELTQELIDEMERVTLKANEVSDRLIGPYKQ